MCNVVVSLNNCPFMYVSTTITSPIVTDEHRLEQKHTYNNLYYFLFREIIIINKYCKSKTRKKFFI